MAQYISEYGKFITPVLNKSMGMFGQYDLSDELLHGEEQPFRVTETGYKNPSHWGSRVDEISILDSLSTPPPALFSDILMGIPSIEPNGLWPDRNNTQHVKFNDDENNPLNLQLFGKTVTKKVKRVSYHYLIGRIYHTVNIEDDYYHDLGTIRIKSLSLDSKSISRAISKTVGEEFDIEQRQKMTKMSQKPQVKRRRRSANDEPQWQPMSVFSAFTDYKPHSESLTVPASSCFGRINMRMKRAWSRGVRKSKKQKGDT